MTATDLDPMPPSCLGVTVSNHGTTQTISLRGEWDSAEETKMMGVIHEAFQRSPECIVLDLTQLSFIDSTGIDGVIELQRRSARHNVRLVILPGPRAVHRPFEILGLAAKLPFLNVEIGR